jgi:hypothetical protein
MANEIDSNNKYKSFIEETRSSKYDSPLLDFKTGKVP